MLLPVVLLFAFLAPAFSPGDTLPLLKGEFLDGKDAELPTAAQGKVALLAFGFTHDSQAAMDGWTTRFRKDFGDKPGVTFYQVSMTGGMRAMRKPFIKGGMRKDTPKEDYEHVVTVFGGAGSWKERLRFKEENDAYVILLGQEGIMRWIGHGKADDAKYTEMAETARRLLGK